MFAFVAHAFTTAATAVATTAVAIARTVRDSLDLLLAGPTKENETMREARLRAEHQHDLIANARESDRQNELLEVERRKAQVMEAELKRLGEEMLAASKRRDSEVENTREEEERRRREDEEAQRKFAEEKRELEERLLKLEEREKTFGGPLRWPTSAEFKLALKRTKYNNSNFHFAIVGRAGSGKSSLINAFINLRSSDTGAAPTGATETTLDIGRYPDPGKQAPRDRIVWFDVPGAGTQRIPHEDYFIRQGLFVFDLIVLAIGDRFEQIDVRIITDCARFKVPLFIVRSKADMHIRNMVQECDDNYARISDNPELYIQFRDEFLEQTQRSVSEGLKMEGLQDQQVYIVSRSMLQRTYHSALQEQGQEEGQEEGWPKSLTHDPAMIHEMHLVTNLLGAAVERRCNMKERRSMVDKEEEAVVDSQLKDMALDAVLPERDGEGPLPRA